MNGVVGVCAEGMCAVGTGVAAGGCIQGAARQCTCRAPAFGLLAVPAMQADWIPRQTHTFPDAFPQKEPTWLPLALRKGTVERSGSKRRPQVSHLD